MRAERRSTWATTAASKPTPTWKRNCRPLTLPTLMARMPPGPSPERGQQLARGLDGVVCHADGAGEDVRGPARQHPEGAGGAGEPVGGLVERAVAAEDHDHVGSRGRRPLGQAGGVPPAAGLRHGDLMVGGERLLDHHPGPGGDRRGRGVDDEQQTHAWAFGLVQASARATVIPWRATGAAPRCG